MVAISNKIFSDAFPWIKISLFWLTFHWHLFLRVQLIITQHCLDNGLALNRRQATIWTNADLVHWRIYAALAEVNTLHAPFWQKHNLPISDFIISYHWDCSGNSNPFLFQDKYMFFLHNHPDRKVHGANMGPIWDRQDLGGPHVGPMDFAIWALLQLLKWYHQLKYWAIFHRTFWPQHLEF